MALGMKSYDAKGCTLSFAGIQITGFADGEFVSIDDEADTWGDVVGTDGEVTRFRTNDNRANVVIRTMQSSSVNDQLSAILQLDKLGIATGGNPVAGIGVFYFQDTFGTSYYRGENSWIMKPPAASFDRGVKEREWKIRVAALKRFDGSNVGT